MTEKRTRKKTHACYLFYCRHHTPCIQNTCIAHVYIGKIYRSFNWIEQVLILMYKVKLKYLNKLPTNQVLKCFVNVSYHCIVYAPRSRVVLCSSVVLFSFWAHFMILLSWIRTPLGTNTSLVSKLCRPVFEWQTNMMCSKWPHQTISLLCSKWTNTMPFVCMWWGLYLAQNNLHYLNQFPQWLFEWIPLYYAHRCNTFVFFERTTNEQTSK